MSKFYFLFPCYKFYVHLSLFALLRLHALTKRFYELEYAASILIILNILFAPLISSLSLVLRLETNKIFLSESLNVVILIKNIELFIAKCLKWNSICIPFFYFSNPLNIIDCPLLIFVKFLTLIRLRGRTQKIGSCDCAPHV